MTQASKIPIESAARSCQCLESQLLRSTAQPDLGLRVVANTWLSLAFSLAGFLIWRGSSHGAWRYGAADLGFLLVGAAFGIGAVRISSRAWVKRAYGARQPARAVLGQCARASNPSLHSRSSTGRLVMWSSLAR